MKLHGIRKTNTVATILICVVSIAVSSTFSGRAYASGEGEKIVKGILRGIGGGNIPGLRPGSGRDLEEIIPVIFVGLFFEMLHQEKLRSEKEVKKDWEAEGKAVPKEPMVEIVEFESDPGKVEAGKGVTLSVRYIAVGESKKDPLKGQLELMRENRSIEKASVEISARELSPGERRFTAAFAVPKSQLPGEYQIFLTLENDKVKDRRPVTIEVTKPQA